MMNLNRMQKRFWTLDLIDLCIVEFFLCHRFMQHKIITPKADDDIEKSFYVVFSL